MTETKSAQRSHNSSCLVTSPNHSPKKCKTNYIRVKLTHTKTSRNNISETEIIGRLNFLKTTHFRIVHLCKERTFYLDPFSLLETKDDRTMGRIPFEITIYWVRFASSRFCTFRNWSDFVYLSTGENLHSILLSPLFSLPPFTYNRRQRKKTLLKETMKRVFQTFHIFPLHKDAVDF